MAETTEPKNSQLPTHSDGMSPTRVKLIHWFLILVMALGLVGGSCAMQDVLPTSTPTPTVATYKRQLEALNLTKKAQLTSEQTDDMAKASLTFLKARQGIQKRYRTPLAVASGLLVLAYMALFVVAHRVWKRGGRWVQMLSNVALVALPIRVALAGVEYAALTQVWGPTKRLLLDMSLASHALAGVDPSQGEDALRKAGELYGKMAVSLWNGAFWIELLLCLAILYATHILFARPDVQALFNATEEDDDSPRAP